MNRSWDRNWGSHAHYQPSEQILQPIRRRLRFGDCRHLYCLTHMIRAMAIITKIHLGTSWLITPISPSTVSHFAQSAEDYNSLVPSKKFRIFRATPVFPYPCPSRIHHPIRYTRTQSWSWAPNCSGYGSWIITTHQLITFIHRSGEHPLRVALKPRYITSQHTIHQASEEIISQRIALKPRLYIHIITVTKHPNTNNVSPDGQPSQTTASDYGSGLLRTTASYPVGCARLLRTMPTTSGLLRTTPGLLRSARPDTGVLGTRPEDQPGPRGKLPTRLPVSLCRFSLHLQLPD